MSTLMGKLRAFLLWNKATNLCSKTLYSQANIVVYDIYRALAIEPFSPKMMPLVSLRFAYILQKCGNLSESDRACAAAIEYLDVDIQKKERQYGADEGRYLSLYAKYMAQYNNSVENEEEIELLRKRYMSIDLTKVSAQVKNMFPLNHDFLSC